MNAEDLAASRWKTFRQAKVEQASEAHAQAVAKLEELRGQVGPTKHADRQALGQALVEGKAEPAWQAEKLQAEIAAQERRVAALLTVIDDANTKLTETITTNASDWHKAALRQAVRARGRYERAVEEFEASRQALSDEVGLAEWAASGGARFGEAANDTLAGRATTRPGEPPPLNFTRVINALREDIEHLSNWMAVDRELPQPRLDWARVRRADA